jgi:AraC-like DNA-binding protein
LVTVTLSGGVGLFNTTQSFMTGASGVSLTAAAGATPPGAAAAAAWNRRFDLLEEFLLRHAATGPEPSAPVEWAWRRLLESGGLTPIGALADEIGWSGRHLIARFRQQIGLPPKTAARVIRFARLLRLIDGAGTAEAAETRWDRLAATCGYYDQAHLNRDFREFAGTTPTDYVLRRVPSGNVVAGDAVPAGPHPRRPATTPVTTR